MLKTDTFLPFGAIYTGMVFTRDTQHVRYDTTVHGCLLTITENVTVSPSATSELDNALGLRVFPNPTSSEFFIEMDFSQGATQLSIEAFDPIGRSIKLIAENDLYPTDKHRLKVDASQWPSGVYLLCFQVNEVSIFKKIIKI